MMKVMKVIKRIVMGGGSETETKGLTWTATLRWKVTKGRTAIETMRSVNGDYYNVTFVSFENRPSLRVNGLDASALATGEGSGSARA